MKAIMLMFDSLNKDMLSAYGCDDTITPNFKRLKERSVTFDNFYVGSLPCMPARRELHTGRYNFLHRGWSPLEPFDDSMPELLKGNGVHTHLVTDHKHYWRDGGATYHNRYSTYDFIRGQEGDLWIGQVDKPTAEFQNEEPEKLRKRKMTSKVQDLINREHMKEEKEHHLSRTVSKGLEFINRNKNSDNWFLQIECFDPHEPFFVPQKYLDMYGITESTFDGWPPYYFVKETPERKNTIKIFYQALLTMCDEYLGKVLDKMDKENLWGDTMLIVNTDHGFLLGEHDWWGKNIMPVYNEIANTPFFIWDPRYNISNERRSALAQTIDIAPTLLEYFNCQTPKDMLGIPLTKVIMNDEKIRDYALFGYIGSHVNITDGEYVYMRSPREKKLRDVYEYTLMPTRISSRFTPKELKKVELVDGFDFTKGCKVLRVPLTMTMASNARRFGDKLYCLKEDRNQRVNIESSKEELRLARALTQLLKINDAPKELYSRLNLTRDSNLTLDSLEEEKKQFKDAKEMVLSDFIWGEPSAREGFLSLLNLVSDKENLKNHFKKITPDNQKIYDKDIIDFIIQSYPEKEQGEILYKVQLDMRLF